MEDVMTAQVRIKNARERLLAAMPVTERRLQLAGISTAVLEAGEGDPVVLLHGPAAHAAHWIGVIPELARTCRVIVPDLPGHGASKIGGGALDGGRVLEWLGALIERACATPPVLVGQLLGGAIAARFTIAHGARVERLVLVDTFGLVPLQPAPEFGRAIEDYLTQPTPATHDALWRHCAFDLGALRGRMGELWEPFAAYNVDNARTPEMQAAVHSLMGAFAFPAIAAEDLARIAVPTALIWGRHDAATPLAVAQAASKRYGWPLQVIENANDDPPIEQPEALLEALRTALADSRSPKRRAGA
jgi:pimeloyl-ACP methyl ester carboxylesterase